MINLRQADQQLNKYQAPAQPIQSYQAPMPSANPSPVQNILNTAGKINTAIDKTPVVGDIKRMATGGLGKIGEALMVPSNLFGGYLRGSRQKAEELGKQGGISKYGLGGFGEIIKSGVQGAREGLKTKVSPGQYLTEDVLKTKNPYAKFGISLATDLTADPLNFAGSVLPKLGTKLMPVVNKAKNSQVVQKAVTTAKKTPLIYKPIEATVNPYFRNPEAGKIIEGTKQKITERTQNLFRQISESSKGMSKASQKRIGQLLEGGIATAKTEPKLVEIANHFKQMGEQVGKELVQEGLLDPKSYEKYKGKYMHHFWQSATGGKDIFNLPGVPTIDPSILKLRKGAQGYIREFAPATFKGLGTGMRNVEVARMNKQLAKFAKTPTTQEEMYDLAKKGYKYAEDISKTKGGQVLNKNLLPGEVIDYIKRNKVSQSGILGKIYDTGMRAWKAGKTVYNPAYHARNLISNHILADMQTGRGLAGTAVDFVRSARALKGKGEQKFIKEATDHGLIRRKAFGSALDELLDPFKKEGKLKKIATAPQKFQQANEDVAKLAVFSHYRKKGLAVAEAAKKAEEAIFSPYKISKGERDIMSRLIPFYSFTRQAAPFTAKTLLKHPERMAKYPKAERAVERMSENDKPNEENMPDYMKSMVRTPLKNEKGETKYFNTRYLYPFGSFTDEGQGAIDPLLGLGSNPLLEEIIAQRTGIDPYFKSEFVREGMPDKEKLKARAEHAWNNFAPNWLGRTTFGKVIPSVQGKKDYQGRERNLPEVLTGEVTGLKTYPYSTQQGAKSKSYQRYKINEDYETERNKVMKQKLSPKERIQRLREYLQYRNERLQALR